VVENETSRLDPVVAILHQASVRIALLSDPLTAEAGHTLRAVAERLIAERRKREEYFPTGLFGEPAWDLLLALYVAHDEGRPVALAEAYRAAKVAPRDGPALVERLIAYGLVARSPGSDDAIQLTEHGWDRLNDYLADLI
jgi:DNA-binding MarR family transcriptional regulator